MLCSVLFLASLIVAEGLKVLSFKTISTRLITGSMIILVGLFFFIVAVSHLWTQFVWRP